jgi:hypothetical protein
MIPAIFLFIAMGASSLTETPVLAYELASNMTQCQKFDWTKMEDDENNVRYTITFKRMSLISQLKFERTMVNKYNSKQSKKVNQNEQK